MLLFIASVKSVMIWLKISKVSTVLLSFQLSLLLSPTQFQEFQLIAPLLLLTLWMDAKKISLLHRSKQLLVNFYLLSKKESPFKKRTLSLHLPQLQLQSRHNSINISTIPLTFSLNNSLQTQDQNTNNLELKSLRPSLWLPEVSPMMFSWPNLIKLFNIWLLSKLPTWIPEIHKEATYSPPGKESASKWKVPSSNTSLKSSQTS